MALQDYADVFSKINQKPYAERKADAELEKREKQARIGALDDLELERAFKKRKLLFDTEKMENERRETERKNKMFGARDQLAKMEADLDTLLGGNVNPQKVTEMASQYEDPRLQALFTQAATTGDATLINQAQELADQQLVRSGYLKPEEKKPRDLFVSKSGKVIFAPEDDPRIERPITIQEKEIGSKLGGFSEFGTDKWLNLANPTKIDEVVEVQDPRDLTKTLMVPKAQAQNYRPASNAAAARSNTQEHERQKREMAKEVRNAEKDLNESFGDVQKTIALNDQFYEALTDPNMEGAVGLLDQYTGKLGAQLGSEEGVLGRRLTRLSSQLVLEAAGNLKGALSDRDIKFLQDTQPKLSDGPEVWKDWYNNNWLPTYNSALKTYGREKSRVDSMKGELSETDAKLEEIRAKYGSR